MELLKTKIKWSIIIEPEVATEYAGTKLGAYFTNPDIMVETELKAAKLFYDLYDYGSPEVKSLAVNTVYYTCASVLGAKVVYLDDDSPMIEERVIKEIGDIKKLGVKDIESARCVQDALKRYEYLKKKSDVTGIVPIFSLPVMGPYGTAIVLRGTNLFGDINDDPNAVKELMEIITETAIRLLKFQEKVNGENFVSMGMDDDYGGLISPELYEEFSYPYLKRIYDRFGKNERFMHSETLGRGHLKYLRKMGITNYDAWQYHNLTVRDIVEELPDMFFTWNCETTRDLYSDTPEMIKNKFRQAITDGAPGMNLDLCARRIPRENIKAFIEVAKEFD